MAKRSVNLKAVDARTGQPVSGAEFFINGVKSSSPASLEIGLSHVFEAKASGYSSATVSKVIAGGDSADLVTLSLPSTSANVTVRIQFYPAEPGISFELSGPTTKSAVSFAGGVAELNDIAPGAYQIVSTDDRFEPKTQSVEISPKRSFVVTLVRKAGDGEVAEGPSRATSLFDVESADSVSSGLTEDISEEIYDNAAYEWYFTGAQARLYIGSLFIDQLDTIQFALQQNNVPIHGYCSEFADAYGRGRSLIQGQIVINYVHNGYLYNALEEQARMNSAGADLDTLPKEIAEALRSNSSVKMMDLIRNSRPADIINAQNILRRTSGQFNYYTNPLYSHRIFNMRIEIGDGPSRSYRLLEAVKLGQNEMIVDAKTNQPLAEAYGFVARRLR